MAENPNITMQERFAEQVVANRDVSAIDALVSPSFVDHDPAPDQGPGVAGFKDFWTSFLSSFPDLALSVEAMVADGPDVAFAYTARGTHSGDFLGYAPTGKTFEIRGLQISRFDADSMLVERWGQSDVLGILQQVGAI